jgi:hypothetical protein
MKTLVVLAGVGQIALVVASAWIPRVLGWRRELDKLRPLTRTVVTTYAFYIAGTNLAFGLLSAWRADWLLDGSGLARALAGFIAVYWGARVVLQFAYYDRTDAPSGAAFRLAEAALVALFLFLTAVYGWVGLSGGGA